MEHIVLCTVSSVCGSYENPIYFALKKNRYTSGRSTYAILFLSSFLNGGQLLKERVYYPGSSNFYPLRVDPILKGLYHQENKQEVTKIVSL